MAVVDGEVYSVEMCRARLSEVNGFDDCEG
jgi:hypothetical protein